MTRQRRDALHERYVSLEEVIAAQELAGRVVAMVSNLVAECAAGGGRVPSDREPCAVTVAVTVTPLPMGSRKPFEMSC